MPTVKRWDVSTPRKKYNNDGVWWHRVGTALESDRGQITIYLDSVPLPDPESNQIKMMLFEPKESRDGKPSERAQRPSPGAAKGPGEGARNDDEIPF